MLPAKSRPAARSPARVAEEGGFRTHTVGRKPATKHTHRLGLAQPAVLAVFKSWFRQRGLDNSDIAIALGLIDEGAKAPQRTTAINLVRKQLSGGAPLPESKADAWGQALGRNRHEREAVANLIVLANAHARVLVMLDDWQGLVDRLGRVLLKGRRRR